MEIQKNMARKICFALLVACFSLPLFLLTSCEDDDNDHKGTTRLVNSFIVNYMEDAYLWNDKMPGNINIDNEPDPKALFKRLVYKEYDDWSSITDDAKTLLKSYEGVSTTFGYFLGFGRFIDTDNCFAFVRYVYPNSPAAKAGIQRGDIIIRMNDADIKEKQLLDLYYSSSISLQFGEINDGDLYLTNRKVSMKAVEMNVDAINAWKIIPKGQHKIGYVCYTDYIKSSHSKLEERFSYFKQQGVTDIVLDLRYNPGGAALTALHLSSILAPAQALSSKSIFLTDLWNKNYMDYYESEGEDTNEYFDPKVPVNMDLSRLYVLTTENTASASEATIVGLSPYMDVIKIGTKTHGKYCAAALLQAKDKNKKLIKEIDNWMMTLVVYKFANSDGFTDFKGGLAPDYHVEEDWKNLYPFGDERDPLLGKAIELITGENPAKALTPEPRGNDLFRLLEDKDFRRNDMIVELD